MMTAKKLLMFMTTIAMLVVFAVGCGSSSTEGEKGNDSEANDKPITLKVASFVTEKSFVHQVAILPWMNKVTELTEGQVKFDLYPSEQLGKAGDIINLTRDGVADIGVTDLGYFPDELPLSNMLANLPIKRETTYQANMAYYDLVHDGNDTTVMENDFVKNGVRLVLTRISPSHAIWTKGTEIRVPEDLKGMRVRTSGGPTNKIYEMMGAVPTTIHFPDIYEAVERGVVEAVHLFGIGMKTSGAAELVTYGLETNRGGSTFDSIVINEKVWQSLPEHVQTAMMDAAREVTIDFGQINDIETMKFNEEFIENGGKMGELTEAEQAQWSEFSDKFIQSWLDENKSKGVPFEEVLNKYNENLDKYKN